MSAVDTLPAKLAAKTRAVKCVVWDLDDTLWDGILLEGGAEQLRPGVLEALRTLDERGILNSIASRNSPDVALERLRAHGVEEYFLVPQIGWGSKSESVGAIAKALNIGIDALAFIDDQPFERDEVASVHPQVLCLDATEVAALTARPEFIPEVVTADSRNRRRMYLADQARTVAEERFEGPQEAFLADLGMVMSIAPAREDDLLRAEELTRRTNQLNTTGETFGLDDLRAFANSPDHLLLMAGLDDRYGSYGKIGLALVAMEPEGWRIRLLLMSCRVMSRGVGAVLINHLRDRARAAGVRLLADFVSTDRNRMMYVTYKFNHFKEIGKDGARTLLENDLSKVQSMPDYLELNIA